MRSDTLNTVQKLMSLQHQTTVAATIAADGK